MDPVPNPTSPSPAGLQAQLYDASGQPIPLSDDAAQAVVSGQAGFLKGEKVHVVKDGVVGTVPSEQAGIALQQGSRLATDSEIHQAKVEAKYGGASGMAMTGLLGAASGLTAGLSDAAISGLGGKQYIQEHREANPLTFTGGQVLGAVAPAFVGDEAGLAGLAAEGADAAKGTEALGAAKTAIKAASAPYSAMSAAGKGIEKVVQSAMGAENGGSVIAGLAKKALTKGAGSAAEAALVGGAQQLDEDMLGDHEINGEKLLAAMGHGALLGLVGGAGLTAAGEIGSHVLGRAKPALGGLAEEEAFRALNSSKAFAKEAENIPGGARGIGRKLLHDKLIGFGERVEDIAPKIEKARIAAGEKISSILETADNAGYEGPNISEIERQVRRQIIPKLEKLRSSNRGALDRVEGLLNDLKSYAEGFSPHEVPEPIFGVSLASDELKAAKFRGQQPIGIDTSYVPYVKDADSSLTDEMGPQRSAFKIPKAGNEVTLSGSVEQTKAHKIGNKPFGLNAKHDVFLKPEAFTDELSSSRKPINVGEDLVKTNQLRSNARKEYEQNLRLNFQQAHEFRSLVDDHIRWSTNPLMPVNETTEAMKTFRNIVEGAIERSGDKAAQEMGGSFLDDYRKAKLAYRQLKVAHQAAEDAVTRGEANRKISLSDYIAGNASSHFPGIARGLTGGLTGAAAGAAGDEAEGTGGTGLLAGAATGVLGALAHHAIRTRGNATAAVMLDKLASLRGIERASTHIDNQIDRGIGGFFKEEGRIPVKLKEPIQGAGDEHAAVTSARKAIDTASRPVQHVADIERAASPIAEHAPKVSNSFQRAALRATMYLAQNAPKPLTKPSITPQFDRPVIPDAQKADYARQVQAVHDPMSVLSDMSAGRVTRSQVQAIQVVYPSLYNEVVQRFHERLADLKTPLSYSQKVQMSTLLGQPADQTLTPEFIGAVQANYHTRPDGGPGGHKGHGHQAHTQRPLRNDLSKDVALSIGRKPG